MAEGTEAFYRRHTVALRGQSPRNDPLQIARRLIIRRISKNLFS
jgi:hypothetical protein